METWELGAREAIRELIARYNSFGDRGRIAELAGLFAPDGVLEAGGRRHTGPGAIAAFLTSLVGAGPGGAGRPEAVRHFTAATWIEIVDRRTARAGSSFEVLTARGFDHCGRYDDELTVVDGNWRFARRRAVTEIAVAGGWADARLTVTGTSRRTRR
ncbi:MAG TPA: nuclear transport factor 2 family protein [Acidimicrobiia bacterium]|nr:nuclear transport factor 2 family protein [Acidimicrobiia bacterium]